MREQRLCSASSTLSDDKPPPKDVQFMLTDNLDDYILISVQRFMSDPTIIFQPLGTDHLRSSLNSFFAPSVSRTIQMEILNAPSCFNYQLNNASGHIEDNDDLQEACKYWERIRTPKWRVFLHRTITGLSISLPYAGDEHRH